MASVLAVVWTWKLALGVLSVAALVWFLLAAFVASRWPALHPAFGKLRSPPARAAVVGVLVALAVGAFFLSRDAYARGHSPRDEFGRRRSDRRLVLVGGPQHRLVISALGQPRLTLVHVNPCHGHAMATADEGSDAADAENEAREAQEEARAEAEEARQEAEEQAREAQEEARDRAQEAQDRARERAEEARERAQERAEQARERAQQVRERAQEVAQRQMERAQQIMERMGDEMDTTRDEVQEGLEVDSGDGDRDGDRRHERSRLESFLEHQAEKVERLGRTMADQLRGLASRFGEDDEDGDRDHDRDRDDDHDEDGDSDSVDL